MIKINFATRKQSSAAVGAGGRGKKGLKGPKLDLSDLGDLPLKKIGLAGLACFIGSYMLDDYKLQEINAILPVIDKLQKENKELKKELTKTKGFERIKASLEKDEFLIRNKIETIKGLMSDREDTFRMFLKVSEIIPADVWLYEFASKKGGVTLKGNSVGYNPISDFMKGLNETAYLTNLTLQSTSKKSDNRGTEIAEFELTADRRGKVE